MMQKGLLARLLSGAGSGASCGVAQHPPLSCPHAASCGHRQDRQAYNGCCAQVRAEYIALYKQYAPLWEKEETERTARWARFLEDGTFSASDQHAG